MQTPEIGVSVLLMVHVVYLGAAANGGSWRGERGGDSGAPTSRLGRARARPTPFWRQAFVVVGRERKEGARRPSKWEICQPLCDVTKGAYMSPTKNSQVHYDVNECRCRSPAKQLAVFWSPPGRGKSQQCREQYFCSRLSTQG